MKTKKKKSTYTKYHKIYYQRHKYKLNKKRKLQMKYLKTHKITY